MKYIVNLQWAVTVSANLEVEADSATAAEDAALMLVNTDAGARDAAEQAFECVRDGGPELVAPGEAVGKIDIESVEEEADELGQHHGRNE